MALTESRTPASAAARLADPVRQRSNGRGPDERHAVALGIADETGLPRCFLPGCLLLALAEGQSHGYELLERIREMGVRSVEPGGLYRALRSLEREGSLSSAWERSSSGPPRRRYALTLAGRRKLRGSMEAAREARALLADLVDRYDRYELLSRSQLPRVRRLPR